MAAKAVQASTASTQTEGSTEGSVDGVPGGDGSLLHQRNDENVPQKRLVRPSSSLRSIRYNSVAYV